MRTVLGPILKLLALPLIAAVVLAPAPAQADLSPTAKQLINELKRIGITSEVTYCERGTIAKYHPDTNHLTLCLGTGTSASIEEILAHESTHVVQDCLAGINNSSLALISAHPTYGERFLNILKTDEHAYRGASHLRRGTFAWAIELESYALEQDPAAVLIALRKFCPTN